MQEVMDSLPGSEKALKQALYRMKVLGRIDLVRAGFYIIIPPEFSQYKTIPADLFIDDLMAATEKQYYVGLFSAAGMYGASHQAHMEYYVITEPPAIRHIRRRNLLIRFFVKRQWSSDTIVKRKTDAGYINLSSPELTAVDLLDYGQFGINKIATVLKELSGEMRIRGLKVVLRTTNTSTIQRLGYILDTVLPDNKFAPALLNELDRRELFPVPLLKGYLKKGQVSQRWKIIENSDIETDI